jgi:hypothetical protein
MQICVLNGSTERQKRNTFRIWSGRLRRSSAKQSSQIAKILRRVNRLQEVTKANRLKPIDDEHPLN